MPIYDYKCTEHGVFNALATMEDCAQPGRCPQCGTLSPRVIVIPPSILAMAEEKRKTMEINEAARHEPQLSTVDSRLEQRECQRHRCGCGSRHRYHDHSSNRELPKRTLLYTADGSKIFPSARPWMISH